MDSGQLAASVIILSVLTGIGISLAPEIDLQKSFGQEKSSDQLRYGSAHEHALFYVIVNGTELDFTADRFQLQSKYVHLENRRSHIVHKHSKGVTWEMFLDTINVSIQSRGDEYCARIYNRSYCGKGNLSVPGGLNSTVGQGENFILALGKNASSAVERYRKKELPEDYRPEKPGHGV